MSRPRPKKLRGKDRHVSVWSVLRDEPDLEKIAGSMFAWAQSLAYEEAEQAKAKLKPDPFTCDCMCNCCKLRRLHDGLCPQPSDEDLERVA